MSVTPITFEQCKAFMVAHYKHERLYGRTQANGWTDDYGDRVVLNCYHELIKRGAGIISKHESKSGEALRYNKVTIKAYLSSAESI